MFYVSDITGVQIPYTAELFRLQREQQLQRLAAGEQTNGANDVPITTGESTEAPSTTNTTPSSQANSFSENTSVSVGTAGATMQRSRGVTGRKGATSQQGYKELEPHAYETPPVVSSHAIRNDPTKEEHFHGSQSYQNPYAKLEEPQPKRAPALLALQIMTQPVVTLEKHKLVSDAAKLFKAKRFRHIPIATKERKLIGIISDRDALTISDRSIALEKVMIANVLSARPQTEIRHIAKVMFEERIGAMPIVDEQLGLVGIITRSDILRAVINKAPLELWI